MHAPPLLNAADSVLILIDLQQRLVAAMSEPSSVVSRALLLARAAQRLQVPVLVTRQRPTALGALVPELAEVVPALSCDKTAFSCLEVPALAAYLAGAGRKQLVLAGVEAHVCILQSALGLAAAGFDVFVVADAVGSRYERDRTASQTRLTQAGIVQPTAESVVFEWLRDAAHPEFRALLALVK